MILRFLNPQGIAGLAASLCLALLLIIQKGETRHWRKQSDEYRQLYLESEAAFAATVANYRAAAERARASDRANAERIIAEQRTINERTENEFEARLADARAVADLLRRRAAAADPGGRGGTSVHGLPAAAGRPSQGPGQDGLSDRLLATEQAIQLDELIKWVKLQAAVDPNGNAEAR